MSVIKTVIFCGIISFLTSCTSTSLLSSPAYQINEIAFKNHGMDIIYDVTIRVEKTHAVFSCGSALPHSACSNRFPVREYTGNAFRISWTSDGKKYESPEVALPLKGFTAEDMPLTAVIAIDHRGYFAAHYE